MKTRLMNRCTKHSTFIVMIDLETITVGIYLNIVASILWEKSEDSNEVNILCNSKKDIQHNGQNETELRSSSTKHFIENIRLSKKTTKMGWGVNQVLYKSR